MASSIFLDIKRKVDEWENNATWRNVGSLVENGAISLNFIP